MNINFDAIANLIETMDRHPMGASLFVVALLICSAAAVSWCFRKR